MTPNTLRLLFVTLTLVPSAVHAQPRLASGGMDLRLFRPAVDSKGLFAVDGTDILGNGDISFGLVLDAGFGLVPFEGFVNDASRTAAQAERTDRLVQHLFTGTLHLNYGISNLAVVGAQLPVQVASGPNTTVPGQYNGGTAPQGLDQQGLGDIVLHGKLRLLRAEREPVGLAIILRLGLPTGNASAFTGEPGLSLWPTVALELRPARPLRLALNAGYRMSFGTGATVRFDGRTIPGSGNATGAMFDPTSSGAALTYGDLLTVGVGASLRIFDVVDLVAEASATQLVGAIGDRGSLSVEAIGGLKVFVERNSYLLLGGGVGLVGGLQSPDARAVLGFVFEPSIGDRDGDGLRDDVDQCPDEPEDFDGFADEDGCPDPDNDRDGILDVDDECPMVPEDRDGDADEDGCPEGNRGDRDGDGLLDEVDQCPDDPEDQDGFQDDDGCPDPDNDQDGILDGDDLCPNDPEDADNFSDEDGCPDPDNDSDRILDVDDECPNDPEMYNNYQDEDGCPDHGILEVQEEGFVLFEQIYFQTDSAQILARSYPLLDAITAALQGHPDITLVEIQGHADERSSDEYNIRLTRDRAAAVRAALTDRGVDGSRMRSAGYGERCPVDPRHNAQAWERNRRVDIKILRTTAGPTNALLICPAGRELVPE